MVNKIKTPSRLNHAALVFLMALVFCGISIHAQQSEVLFAFEQTRTKVTTLLANEQYDAAYHAWEDLPDAQLDPLQRIEKYFGTAFCGLKAGHSDAVYNMQYFAQKYPLSAHADQASFLIALYYFEKNQFGNAREWLTKVSQDNLSPIELPHYHFMMGYSSFVLGKFAAAKPHFLAARKDQRFNQAAHYYLGFMNYSEGQFIIAQESFDQLEVNSKYHKQMLLLRADMSFKMGDYQKAIDWAQASFSVASAQEKNTLHRLTGAALFALERYSEALPHLESYNGPRGQKDPDDLYQLGYCYYRAEAFDKAISSFNQLVDQNNLLGQNAYYHLGASYLAVGEKPSALNAFKKASTLGFSEVIMQESAFNYAQLVYEVGTNYSSVPQVLQDFLTLYPDHAQANAIVDLLVAALMKEKNYQSVLDMLEGQEGLDQKLAYQRAAFYRGLQAYHQNDKKLARDLFQRSLSGPYGRTIYLRALYWQGVLEADTGQTSQAIETFKAVLRQPYFADSPEYGQVFYELGYAYFKEADYASAASAFEQFLKQDAALNFKSDARLRLGDCHYIVRRYDEALKNYEMISSGASGDRDYAAFQSAICLGLMGDTNAKINRLKLFQKDFPESLYADDALYALGTTYLLKEKIDLATTTFEQLITTMPQSLLVPKCWLKLGLIKDNAGLSVAAIEIFKKIAKDFPASSEAIQAVEAAKNSYVAIGDVAAYAQWVNGLTFVTLENAALDAATFQAALQPYTSGDLILAESRLRQYLADYPQGLSQIEARFYLAQILWDQNKIEQALVHYEGIRALGLSDYSEPSLVRLSEYYLSQKRHQKAQTYLEELLAIVVYPKNKLFAIRGAMQSCYALEQYDEALLRVEQILVLEKVDQDLVLEALLLKARSLVALGQRPQARVAYKVLAPLATQELAAEVLYHEAYFNHLDQDFEASNVLIQELAQEHPSYPYYGAKGLVLMALNFEGLNDLFQANFILENVLDNFQEFPDIMREAETEKQRLKELQSVAAENASMDNESDEQQPQ